MKLKVGIVGAGVIAGSHLQALAKLERAELTAICDVVKEAADKAAAPYGVPTYTDAERMLEEAQLDALIVCVPPFAHGRIEEAAAERGVHLLVEKPVGLDMETVNRKAELFRETGIVVSTGYCLRYLDSLTFAREYLRGKRIASVRAQRFSTLQPAPWWRDMARSGGQLVEMTTHTVDMIRYLAGDFAQVYCDAAQLVYRDVPGLTIPDVTSVGFVLANGAPGHLMTGFFPQPAGRSELEVAGDGFFLQLNGTTVTIHDGDGVRTIENTADFVLAQDEAFLEAIATGDRSLIRAPYEEAAKTLATTLAANESMASGNVVRLVGFE